MYLPAVNSPNTIPPLVTTGWLAERIGRPGLVVLDASWYLPTTGREARQEHLTGHLPGARYFDLDEASDPGSSLPHMLPTPDRFEALARRLGISDDSTIVVYDGSGANLSAARAWWMFRVHGHGAVAVLDGGVQRWQRDGRPLETGVVASTPGRFHARFSPGAVRDLAQVDAALAHGTAQVVDMRSAGRFAGVELEPRMGVPSGHMSGALNLPYAELVGSDGSMLSPDALRARLAAAGVLPDRPVDRHLRFGCLRLHSAACAGAARLSGLRVVRRVVDRMGRCRQTGGGRRIQPRRTGMREEHHGWPARSGPSGASGTKAPRWRDASWPLPSCGP